MLEAAFRGIAHRRGHLGVLSRGGIQKYYAPDEVPWIQRLQASFRKQQPHRTTTNPSLTLTFLTHEPAFLPVLCFPCLLSTHARFPGQIFSMGETPFRHISCLYLVFATQGHCLPYVGGGIPLPISFRCMHGMPRPTTLHTRIPLP